MTRTTISGFAGLRDLEAIRAARAALDVAEQSQKSEAAAEKARAEAEAQKADADAFQREVDAVAGPWWPVEDARAVQAKWTRAHAEAVQQAAKAQDEIARARAVLPELVDGAVAGGLVRASEIAAAHAGVAEAEQNAAFRAVVIARLVSLIAEAETAVKTAITLAHEPVLERGIDFRIEAGIAADAAVTPLGRDMEKTHAAQSLFDRGNALINYAAKRGCIVRAHDGLSLYWPTSERVERRRWKRPAPEDAA